MLEVLGGGCQVPIGAYAQIEGARIHLRAIVASPDGSRLVRGELSGGDPGEVGATLGRQLLREGAAEILREVA